MSHFLSYFDGFAALEQDFTLETPEQVMEQQAFEAEDIANSAADLNDFVAADEPKPEGWGYRNEDVGVGAVFNPDASDWQDMVWVDWD